MLKLCDLRISKVWLENWRPFQGRVTVPSLYKSNLPQQGPWALAALHESCFPGLLIIWEFSYVNRLLIVIRLLQKDRVLDVFLFIRILLSTLVYSHLCDWVRNSCGNSLLSSVLRKNLKNKKLAVQQPLSENWRTRTQWECKRQGVVRDSTICFVDSHLCRKDEALINLSRTRLKTCEKKADRCIPSAWREGAMRWLSR